MYDEVVTAAKSGATLAATGGAVATGTMLGVPIWGYGAGALALGGVLYAASRLVPVKAD